MKTTPARRARLRLLYEGANISADISEDLKSATWTDRSGKQANDLSVVLHNAHGKWSGDWFPSKGAKLTATIQLLDWDEPGVPASLPCGTFEIDEIEVSGGAASTVAIKAVASPVTSPIRGSKKTRSWEDIKLSMIASEIASGAGLSLYYEVDADPEYSHEGQFEETDLEFLQGLCEDAGATIKVTHDKIVIYDQESQEKTSPVLVLTPVMLESYKFKSKTAKVYKSAKVSYFDAESGKLYEAECAAENADLGGSDENGQVLILNQRCKSVAEAEALAKNALRDNNRFEVTGSISCMGDARIVAGANILLGGFGGFDGKYAIESATHTIGDSGYKVSAQLRRALGSEGKKKATAKEAEAGWKDYSSYGEDIYREPKGADG